ncbi:MAG: hypothetical protein WAV95_13710 [Azonexus sp.]
MPPRSRRTALKYSTSLLLALLAMPPARAESVACHITYGGETRLIEARPVSSPYAVTASRIGSFFLFRIVFRQEPPELAGIKIYTYANHDSGPALIHQTSHAYPPHQAPDGGFTGHQAVYEPWRDGELQYWCELKAGA